MNNEPLPDLTPDVSEAATKKPDSSVFTSLLDYVEVFVFSIAIVLVIFTFFGRMCRVDGSSMNQTLEDGENLIVSSFLYTPQKEDIVVFSETSDSVDRLNEAIVKRVIAVAGDTIDIDYSTGTVYVNGTAVTVLDKFADGSDSYVYLDTGKYRTHGDTTLPLTVPEGYVFVMGDNRNNSLDSRFTSIGLVDTRRILGKVVLRVTPLSKFGSVEN